MLKLSQQVIDRINQLMTLREDGYTNAGILKEMDLPETFQVSTFYAIMKHLGADVPPRIPMSAKDRAEYLEWRRQRK